MLHISYSAALLAITLGWILVRGWICIRQRRVCWRRELELVPVWICLIVVARFTFFPFSRVNGRVQPLVLDPGQIFPFRINPVPIVYLMDYEIRREALINFIGNTAMFIPVGLIWPSVFRRLNTLPKAMAAGAGFSLCIEILQLPFFARVSDIDDLILNSLGYLMGYGIYALARRIVRKKA